MGQHPQAVIASTKLPGVGCLYHVRYPHGLQSCFQAARHSTQHLTVTAITCAAQRSNAKAGQETRSALLGCSGAAKLGDNLALLSAPKQTCCFFLKVPPLSPNDICYHAIGVGKVETCCLLLLQGELSGFDAYHKRSKVCYDDGQEEWVSLMQETFR